MKREEIFAQVEEKLFQSAAHHSDFYIKLDLETLYEGKLARSNT